MNSILLSVVVPTKNRYTYLIALVKMFDEFKRDDIELVIQDNSDDNTEFLKFVNNHPHLNLIYNYDPTSISVVENSDRAILNSTGKYVCFLGDDDLLSERVCEFVQYMDKNQCDSAMFQVAKYFWPGTEFKVHKFPNLIIRNYREVVREIDVKKELNSLITKGATSLNMMPKVYHGVVLRERLDSIYEQTGTFFPGPSPDMANSVALALVVKKHIYCDVPFISSGTSPKSAAGLGTKHKHEGNLKDMSFLPTDVEEKWNSNIPKVWTGPTIYAQSAILALQNMKREDLLNQFGYNYHYAYFVTFCPNYKEHFTKFAKTTPEYNSIKFNFSLVQIFFVRLKVYITNIKLTKFRRGGTLKTGVLNTIEAGKYIDEMICNIDIQKMFH